MITLTETEWNRIKNQLLNDWPKSHVIIRSVMKRELGFTTRTHYSWDEKRGQVTSMYLDFYDDTKETWFRMKYL